MFDLFLAKKRPYDIPLVFSVVFHCSHCFWFSMYQLFFLLSDSPKGGFTSYRRADIHLLVNSTDRPGVPLDPEGPFGFKVT